MSDCLAARVCFHSGLVYCFDGNYLFITNIPVDLSCTNNLCVSGGEDLPAESPADCQNKVVYLWVTVAEREPTAAADSPHFSLKHSVSELLEQGVLCVRTS